MAQVYTTEKQKTWNECDATPTGKITQAECGRISAIKRFQDAHCKKTNCQCPWRYSPKDVKKLALVKKLPDSFRGDPEKIAQGRKYIKQARAAIESMVYAQVDPKKCVPFKRPGWQPRKQFDAIDELEQSLREIGQIHAGLARRRKDGIFEIFSGERRLRAAQRIDGFKYRLFHMQFEEDELAPFILACAANGNNSPLKPLEMSQAIETLYDDEVLPMSFIAKEIFGISVHKAHAYHRLMHLCEDAKTALVEQKITESDAFRLSSESKSVQMEELQKLFMGKEMRALGNPIPRALRVPGRPKAAAPAKAPLERLLTFSTRLKKSTVALDKLLQELPLADLFRGKPRKQKEVTDAVADAYFALESARKTLKRKLG